MNKNKLIKTLASVAVLTVASNSVWAAGTTAGTAVDNTAAISYSVGGTPQTEIESSEAGNSTAGAGNGSATSFVVDKKIDVIVTAGTDVPVVPGETNKAITFTVENQGNSDENFDLAATQVATGDVFDTSGCTITSPTPVAPATSFNLIVDTPTVITVECAIPAAGGVVVDGADSLVDLQATINGETEDTGADTAAGVEVVFADDTGTTTDGADRNGSHSAVSRYVVETADISVRKQSAVTEDPFNGTTNPKRIPGATIEYTITVANAAGAATATGIVISDAVPGDLTIVSATITGGTSSTATIAGQDVDSVAFDLAGGETAVLTITATVN